MSKACIEKLLSTTRSTQNASPRAIATLLVFGQEDQFCRDSSRAALPKAFCCKTVSIALHLSPICVLVINDSRMWLPRVQFRIPKRLPDLLVSMLILGRGTH